MPDDQATKDTVAEAEIGVPVEAAEVAQTVVVIPPEQKIAELQITLEALRQRSGDISQDLAYIQKTLAELRTELGLGELDEAIPSVERGQSALIALQRLERDVDEALVREEVRKNMVVEERRKLIGEGVGEVRDVWETMAVEPRDLLVGQPLTPELMAQAGLPDSLRRLGPTLLQIAARGLKESTDIGQIVEAAYAAAYPDHIPTGLEEEAQRRVEQRMQAEAEVRRRAEAEERDRRQTVTAREVGEARESAHPTEVAEGTAPLS